MIKRLILLIILLSLLLSSCATLKKTHKENTTTKEVTDTTKDTSSIISNNGEIKDVISTTVGSTGNHECDEELVKLLNKLNTSKASGNNSYKLYYDAQLNELRAEIAIGATQDKEVVTTTDTVKETSVITEIEDYIKKIVVPWWAYALLIYVFRKPILTILRGVLFTFFPAAKGIKTINDLLTPPNKE